MPPEGTPLGASPSCFRPQGFHCSLGAGERADESAGLLMPVAVLVGATLMGRVERVRLAQT